MFIFSNRIYKARMLIIFSTPISTFIRYTKPVIYLVIRSLKMHFKCHAGVIILILL